MNTDRLIDALAQDVAPAPPLPGPWIRATSWLLGTLVYLGTLMLMMTSVPEIVANTRDWLFTFQQLAAVSTATTAAGAAFALTIPGYSGWSVRLTTVTALVWLASLSLGALQEWSGNGVNLAAPGEWGCVAFVVFGGALPGLAMAHMLRKGAPLVPALTTGLSALATAALASVVACLSHPHPNDAVTFAWHGTTIVVLIAIAAAAGRVVLTWRPGRIQAGCDNGEPR